MKRLLVSVFILIFLMPLAAAQAASKNGWVSLFDGKDLNGWKKNGEEKWVVDRGAILGVSNIGKYGYLTTDKTYSNFKLRLRFRCETKGNSGVFTRSKITGDSPKTGPDIVGMQVEVDPTRHTGGIYESGGRGWVAQPTAEGERAIRPCRWNKLEILAQGNHYVTRLNGKQIVDFTDSAPKFTDGVIGLQLHTGGGVSIRFKDIYIQELN